MSLVCRVDLQNNISQNMYNCEKKREIGFHGVHIDEKNKSDNKTLLCFFFIYVFTISTNFIF